MINHVEILCNKWRLCVNKDKTIEMFAGSALDIVKQYNKYLGVFLDEYLDFNVTANVLARAAGIALGAVLTKFRNLEILALSHLQNYLPQVYHQF